MIMKFFEIFNKNKKTVKKQTEKQIVGKIGEDCACKYLQKLGYKIVDRNYLKKWGEIDIVAQKDKKLHFVEVKSVSQTLIRLNFVLHKKQKRIITAGR